MLLLRHPSRALLAVVAASLAASCHDVPATPAEPVTPVDRPALYVDPDTVSVGVGQTVRLAVKTRRQLALRDLLFLIDYPGTVTVDGIGVVRGLQPGVMQVRVLARPDSDTVLREAKAQVVVRGIVASVPTSTATCIVLGSSVQLAWRVYAAAGGGGDQRIRWRSSDPAVATVSELGLVLPRTVAPFSVTGVALADTTITVSLPFVTGARVPCQAAAVSLSATRVRAVPVP